MRIWRCPDPDCEVGSWTERSAEISPRASMTRPPRAEACRQVGQQTRSVAFVARDLGVGWPPSWAPSSGTGSKV
jgi:hypothetical protein